jgi:hypothetical protein
MLAGVCISALRLPLCGVVLRLDGFRNEFFFSAEQK